MPGENWCFPGAKHLLAYLTRAKALKKKPFDAGSLVFYDFR